jgi:flagellar L-ring protein precursor FlgH
MLMNKWNKQILIFCIVIASMVFANIQSALAESLWVDNSAINLFADHRARNVGDILTVVISETTKTSTAKSNSNTKTGSQTLSAGTGIFSFLTAATAAGTDSFKAAGSASANNSVTGNVSVTVKEVQPNGNLVIEGTQSIWQNKDEHKITLNGIVRREDVTASNTVSSTLVANATLKFDGKGPLNAKERQGILTQVLNILF